MYKDHSSEEVPNIRLWKLDPKYLISGIYISQCKEVLAYEAQGLPSHVLKNAHQSQKSFFWRTVSVIVCPKSFRAVTWSVAMWPIKSKLSMTNHVFVWRSNSDSRQSWHWKASALNELCALLTAASSTSAIGSIFLELTFNENWYWTRFSLI